MMFIYRGFIFFKYRKMFVILHSGHTMTSFSHDMTFHRENGRIRLLNTFKHMHMVCIFRLRRPSVLVYIK